MVTHYASSYIKTERLSSIEFQLTFYSAEIQLMFPLKLILTVENDSHWFELSFNCST